MARAIVFFPRQVYMGHDGASHANVSEIFEVDAENRLDVELRLFAANPYDQGISGLIQTTSDPTLVDAAWKTLSGAIGRTGTGVTFASLSGLGRFLRAQLTVSGDAYCLASLVAVARSL